MRLPIPLKALAFEWVINLYPNTLKGVDASKLAKTLVDGYAACLETGDVEQASKIARMLMRWSKYRQVFQRTFAAEIRNRSRKICDRAVVKFKNRTTSHAAEKYGALTFYEALKELDEMGYEVSLELLHTTALLVEARERGHLANTLSDAAIKEWNRRAGFEEGSEALFDPIGEKIKDKIKRRLKSGRVFESTSPCLFKEPTPVISEGQRRFLLGEQNINPTAS